MSLKKISTDNFLNNLKKREFENIDQVKLMEKNLFDRRGYIFKMPKPRSSAILLVSGGLDSIVCWEILMKEYNLKIYPLNVNRGFIRTNKELQSLNFFSNYFNEKYPNLFVKPLKIDLALKQFNLPFHKAHLKLNPQSILESSDKLKNIKMSLTLGSYALLTILGKMYATHLYLTRNIKINTIFTGVTTSDYGLQEQCFTSLRAGMWYLCNAFYDFSWQYTSPVFEKEIGTYFSKADLIKWAFKHDLPIEKTWSCYRSLPHHCGNNCLACMMRKNSFKTAMITDKTIYQANSVTKNLTKKIISARLKLVKMLKTALKGGKNEA
jgi:7-cyano-7-deazaguanine synthase in queuosine biosynthesis